MSSGNQEEGSSRNSKGQKGNNNNKYGTNQYKDRPSPNDPHVAQLLKQYHLSGISDRRQISKLLLQEHGITLSESSIARRKRSLGLRSSHLTTLELDVVAKRQLIRDQMAKDPAGKYGARMVKQKIFQETGIQLTRDYIRAEMKLLDPVGSSARGPAHVKAKRKPVEDAPYSHDNGNALYLPNTMPNSSGTQLGSPSSGMSPYNPPSPSTSMPFPDGMELEFRPYENTSTYRQMSIIHPPEPDPEPVSFPPATPSPAMTTLLSVLQDTTPNMESLTRLIESLDAEVSLDPQSYHTILKGMESAALLERQLSRLISRSRVPNP